MHHYNIHLTYYIQNYKNSGAFISTCVNLFSNYKLQIMPAFDISANTYAVYGTGVIHVEWKNLPAKLVADASNVEISIQLDDKVVVVYSKPAHTKSFNVPDLPSDTYNVVVSVVDAADNSVKTARKFVTTDRVETLTVTAEDSSDGSIAVQCSDISNNTSTIFMSMTGRSDITDHFLNHAYIPQYARHVYRIDWNGNVSTEGLKTIEFSRMNNGVLAKGSCTVWLDRIGEVHVSSVVEDLKTGVITSLKWTHPYADASSSYVLTVDLSGVSGHQKFRVGTTGPYDVSYNTLKNADEIKDIYGLVKAAGAYKFKITAKNSTGRDNGVSGERVHTLTKNAVIVPKLVVNSYTGELTVDVSDINPSAFAHTYKAYLFSDASSVLLAKDSSDQVNNLNGLPVSSTLVDASANMVKSGAKFTCKFNGIADGMHCKVLVVTDNNSKFIATFSNVKQVKRLKSIKNLICDTSRYANFRELSVKWEDARDAGDVTAIKYKVMLEDASNNHHIDSSSSIVVNYAGAQSIIFYNVASKQYVVRVEVVQGSITFYEEIIVNLSVYDTYPYYTDATPNHKPVSVNLHVTLDAAAKVMVFGESPEISGNLVVSDAGLAADDLWKMDSSECLIQFWEPKDAPNTFLAQFTVDKDGSEVAGTFGREHAFRLLNDLHYALTAGGLDASAAMPFMPYASLYHAYHHFDGVGQMALAYAAKKLFGHPAAVSAITNDQVIIDTMNSNVDSPLTGLTGKIAVATQNKLVGNTDTAGSAVLALRLVQTLLFGGGVSGAADRALMIARSVIGQDADRAMNQDNNAPLPDMKQPLRFYPGDQIYFTINFKGFTADNDNNMGALHNSPSAPNGVSSSTLTSRFTKEDSYTFLFHLH
jgi:hypothetical protein